MFSAPFSYSRQCAAALALVAGATLSAAQTAGGAMPQTMSRPQTSQTAQDAATSNPDSTSPQSLNDRDFVHKALQGGSAEIQLGQLAAQKSQSEDVKQFGEKMVHDHSQMADQMMKPLAKQLGVSEPKGLSKQDKNLLATLEKLSGTEFDQTYIKAMVKDHQQDLKDFREEASMSQDPNVKKAAEQGQTVISEHLQMIEQIAQKHGVAMAINGK